MNKNGIKGQKNQSPESQSHAYTGFTISVPHASLKLRFRDKLTLFPVLE